MRCSKRWSQAGSLVAALVAIALSSCGRSTGDPGGDELVTPQPVEKAGAVIEDEVKSLPASSEEVERYLADLEVRARERGTVSARELEPGLEAIRRLGFGLEETYQWMDRFTRRMLTLSEELQGNEKRPLPDPTQLSEQLSRVKDSPLRELKIREYLDTVAALTPEESAVMLERLDQQLLQETEAKVAVDFEELTNEIAEASSKNQKQVLIRKYLEAVDGLDPAKAEDHLKRLDKITINHQEESRH